MADKNLELMKRLIEQKKSKSSSQVNSKKGPESLGSQRPGIKKYKKGGLFDK